MIKLDLFVPADAPVLYAADGDAEHRRRFHFPDDFVPSLEHSEAVISRWRQERLAGERFPFAVRDLATGELLGGCELRPLGSRTANLSYWTSAKHRRRGIASQAVRLVCRAAFEEFGFVRVEAAIDRDNTASLRVVEGNRFEPAGERDGRLLFALQISARDSEDARSAPAESR